MLSATSMTGRDWTIPSSAGDVHVGLGPGVPIWTPTTFVPLSMTTHVPSELTAGVGKCCWPSSGTL